MFAGAQKFDFPSFLSEVGRPLYPPFEIAAIRVQVAFESDVPRLFYNNSVARADHHSFHPTLSASRTKKQSRA